MLVILFTQTSGHITLPLTIYVKNNLMVFVWNCLQAQDVNFAMEASRKSQISFAAANVEPAKTRNEEVISSIKRTLDFSFHDVEELLRLVHLAMEALSSS